MRAYREGDRPAFETLYARYAARIHAFLLRHLSDRARTDDLFQATWLNVHRARATFRDGEEFAPWVYSIANNVRRDDARKLGRDLASLTSDGELPEPPRTPVADGPDAERVQAALAALPEPYREVIILHRWHDLGLAQIAKSLGTTEGAVKVRAHRGYLALRELLTKEER